MSINNVAECETFFFQLSGKLCKWCLDPLSFNLVINLNVAKLWDLFELHILFSNFSLEIDQTLRLLALENFGLSFETTLEIIFLHYTHRLKKFALADSHSFAWFFLYCSQRLVRLESFILGVVVIDVDAQVDVDWLITTLTNNWTLAHTIL